MPTQFFQRLRRRPKDQDSASSDLRVTLSKTGIDYDTCSSNTSLRDYTAMPFPPPRRPLTPPPEPATSLCHDEPERTNPQSQSALFARLPRDVRERIYVELFGQRPVHLEYDFGYAPGCRGRDKRPPDQWRWWHRVCAEEEAKPGDMCRTDDIEDLKRLGRRELLKHKLKGVEWLRTCRVG